MASNKFSISKKINSSSDVVYSIIADYNNAHPKILPKPPFISLKVERGGIGAGTEMLVQIKMFGKVQTYRAVVTEPAPGKTLVETTDTGYITTFSVQSENNGNSCLVTFTTELIHYSGLKKKFEFWVTSKLLQPVYKKELEILASEAAK